MHNMTAQDFVRTIREINSEHKLALKAQMEDNQVRKETIYMVITRPFPDYREDSVLFTTDDMVTAERFAVAWSKGIGNKDKTVLLQEKVITVRTLSEYSGSPKKWHDYA